MLQGITGRRVAGSIIGLVMALAIVAGASVFCLSDSSDWDLPFSPESELVETSGGGALTDVASWSFPPYQEIDVAYAQGGTANQASFPSHYVPSRVGAGVEIACGDDYPGLRGTYLCNISQTGNTVTVTRQIPDATATSGVTTNTFTFDVTGVVTSGAFVSATNFLNLVVTTGGTTNTIGIPVPQKFRNTGDITAVTTATGSGFELTGCDTGDCAIAFNLDGMTATTFAALSSGDEMLINELSSGHRRVDLEDIAAFVFSQISALTTMSGSLADGDTLPIIDISVSGTAARQSNMANVSNYVGNRLAGTNLTYNTTTNQLDASGTGGTSTFLGLTDTPAAFGTAGQAAVVNAAADGLEFVDATGTGDITGVTAGNGLTGGGDTGAVTLSANFSASAPEDVGTAAVGTANTLSRSDHVHGGGGTGITQTQADARYARLGADNTLTGHQTISTTDNAQALTINASGVDGSSVFRVNVPTTGGQQAFQTGRVGQTLAWASFDGNLGGSGDNPGIAFGPGTAGRDVEIYRGGANLLETPDGFRADTLAVSGTLATTQTNLGIVTAFTGLSDTPASITANQCAMGNAGGTAIIFGACGTGMGGTTFLALTDTPNAFTNEAGTILRVNSAADAIEFVAQPSNPNAIPHVGRIPAVSNTSPDLIFLTHDEVGGSREDATLTIGNLGSFCGYGNEPIFGVFGSINEVSPIEALIGVWDSTNSDCTFSEIYSLNEGWLDDQSQIVGTVGGTAYACNLGTRDQNHGMYVKRITSCTDLDDVTEATITVNFLTADTTPVPYWTDGEVTYPAGLYEKVGTPLAYHDIRPIEESHRQGQGSFACGDDNPPDDGGQVCIDSDGRASFSTDRSIIFSTDAEITQSTEFTSKYWTGANSEILTFNYTGANGEFKWSLLGGNFFQIQGTRATATFNISGDEGTVIPSGTVFERDGQGFTYAETTAEATIPAAGIVNNVPVRARTPGSTGNAIPANATFTPDPAFPGITGAVIQTGFSGATGVGLNAPTWPEIWTWIASIDDLDTAAEQAIADALSANSHFLGEHSQLSDVTEDRDGFTDATARYFYLLHGDEGTLQEITGFTASQHEERDDHQWVGPVVTIEDVQDVFEVNPDDTPTPEAFSALRVGDNIYSAIVRPDETTGDLRDPVANDWDTPDGFSRSVAWDGNEWLEVERYFEGAHSADAIFTQVNTGTTFTFGGNTYRWRGENASASPNINPNDGDFIYYTGGNTLREYVVDPRSFSSSWVSRNTQSYLARQLEYTGAFSDQDSALAHIVRNNQRVIYDREPERARGVIRFVGTEGTDIPIGTRVTAENTTIEFETIEGETIGDTGQVDLDARAVVGGTSGNVADNTVFTHSLAGLTGATAEGAFTRGDNVAGGYRMFTVTGYEAPSAAEYSYRWKTLGFADDVELVIGPDRVTGLLRDATADDYDQFHTQSAVVAFDGDQFQKASRRVVGATQASGTWTTVADMAAITGTTHRWRGTHWQDYLVPTPRVSGDVYFNRTQGFREYDGTNWHNVGVSEVFTSSMSEYLGAFLSTQAATDFANENGQWALIEQTSGAPVMQILSGYMAASAEHYEYFWTPVEHPFPRIPLPSTGQEDDLLRYNAATADWSNEAFVTGASISGIGTAADPLNIDVHDILEASQETIRWTVSTDNETTLGATVCNIFRTGPFQYNVTHTRWDLAIPPTESHHYRARLYQLVTGSNEIAAKLGDSAIRSFSGAGTGFYLYFDTAGVLVPSNSRAAVCISRTVGGADSAVYVSRGPNANGSPEESYPDASEDWDRVGWAEYESLDPIVGMGTESHDTEGAADVIGQMGLYYRRTINHGSLIGEDRVDVDHLNDDVVARLLPTGATNDQIAQYNSTTSAWEAVGLPAGVAQSFVALTDTPASITANECVRGNAAGDALEFTTCGGGSIISDGTLTGDGSGGDPLSVANPFTAAEQGRLLPESPTAGQIAVYNATTLAWDATARDAANPPVTGEVLVDNNAYEWLTDNGPSQEVHFSRALTGADDNALIHIDWREWETTDPGVNFRDVGTNVIASYVRHLTTLAPALLVKDSGGDSPIDRSEVIDEDYVRGAVTFRFPRSTNAGGYSDMRLIYIGDHVDDINEDVDQTETSIDVDSSAGMVVGRDYWIVGPVAGVRCTVDKHAEKVRLVSVDTGTSITVTRNLDNTQLPSSDCLFSSGGDVIEDNKRYFTLQAQHENQDNAIVSFTILGIGVRDPIGPVIAESSTLPTTGIETSHYIPASQVAWTLTSDAPAGFNVESVENANYSTDRTGDRPGSQGDVSVIEIPMLAPDGVDGLWVDLEVDGTLRQRKELLWGAASSAFIDGGSRGGRIGARMSSGASTFIFVIWNEQTFLANADAEPNKNFIIAGWSSSTHPADVVLKLRLKYMQ